MWMRINGWQIKKESITNDQFADESLEISEETEE